MPEIDFPNPELEQYAERQRKTYSDDRARRSRYRHIEKVGFVLQIDCVQPAQNAMLPTRANMNMVASTSIWNDGRR